MREFFITDRGVHVGETFSGVEGVSTGVAREPASAAASPQPHTPDV
jgi:hypothetical protein